MTTCATCLYWSKPEEDDDDFIACEDRLIFGKCRKIIMFETATDWSEDGTQFGLKPEFADLKAAVKDGSSYYAALLTKAEFGCVHWEQE